MHGAQHSAEHLRLQEAREHKALWNKWGPYLSERQWETVLDLPKVRAWGDEYRTVLQRGIVESIRQARAITPLETRPILAHIGRSHQWTHRPVRSVCPAESTSLGRS